MSKSISFTGQPAELQIDSPLFHVPAGEYTAVLNELPTDLTIICDQPGSRLRLRVATELRDISTATITVQHTAPNTEVEIQIRSAVYGNYTLQALLDIAPNTPGCTSYLTHQTLLLSPEARVFTRPSLAIHNNQVACSHAATIRTITNEDLFPLRSRGIAQSDAYQLLIEGFLHT